MTAVPLAGMAKELPPFFTLEVRETCEGVVELTVYDSWGWCVSAVAPAGAFLALEVRSLVEDILEYRKGVWEANRALEI